MESVTGEGAAPVTVDRTADVTSTARTLAARSYTAGGDVHIPAEHGSLAGGEGGALLAHEMVHAAQQRRLGAALPPEASPEGRRLEAEAVAAEGRVGRRSETPAPRHDAIQPAPSRTLTAVAAPARAGARGPADDGHVRGRRTQALPLAPSFPAAEHAAPVMRAPRLPGSTALLGQVPRLPAPVSEPMSAPPDSSPVPPPPPVPVGDLPAVPPGSPPDRPAFLPAPPAATGPAGPGGGAEGGDGTDVDELVGKLYGPIRDRLRAELLVLRERSNLLTDL